MAMVPVQSGSRDGNGSEVQERREPLTEEIFNSFLDSPSGNLLNTIFGEGRLFDPFLLGSFSDPAEAFPLWSFDPFTLWDGDDAAGLLWSETEDNLIIRAQIPGLTKSDIQVIVEDGKTLEISGQWKKSQDSKGSENGTWRGGKWWEVGYIRRLTLPEDTNVEKMQTKMQNGVLNITIPKGGTLSNSSQVKIVDLVD